MADFGAARTNAFMLSDASVLVGPQADLYKLTPENNSLGLVKNFSLKSDTGYVELTQGVQNNIVDSTQNKSTLTATWEAYEYTTKNIAYALGLNGALYTKTALSTALTTATSGTVTTPDVSIEVDTPTGFAVGDWVVLKGSTDEDIYVDKISAISTNTFTLARGVPAILTAGAVLKRADAVDLGSSIDQPYLSMAAVGRLKDGTLVKVEVPKIRITKGFTLGFQTNNYGNLPFETTVYRPVSTDPNYADFSTQSARLVKVTA